MVEEKRKLRSPTKEMKLLVKIGLEETEPTAQVKEGLKNFRMILFN